TDPGYVSGESYTASINWGDNTSSTGTVSFTLGSAGVASTGTVTGSHTYTTVADYTVTVTVSDDDNVSGTGQFVIHVLTHGATKFFVVDQPAHHIFAYDQAGNLSGGFDVSHNNQRGWGIVTDAKMDKLWIVD